MPLTALVVSAVAPGSRTLRQCWTYYACGASSWTRPPLAALAQYSQPTCRGRAGPPTPVVSVLQSSVWGSINRASSIANLSPHKPNKTESYNSQLNRHRPPPIPAAESRSKMLRGVNPSPEVGPGASSPRRGGSRTALTSAKPQRPPLPRGIWDSLHPCTSTQNRAKIPSLNQRPTNL